MFILIVDDEETLVDTMVSFFKSVTEEVDILCAYSAEEAWDILQTNLQRRGLVITDYKMQGWSGVDLAKKIREKSNELPIILMTGYLDKIDEPQIFDLVLEKPFKINQLYDCISNFIT